MNLFNIIILKHLKAFLLFNNIVNTQKNYHAIVLSTFILSIIFRGSLNTYFSSPMVAHVPYVQSAGFQNLYDTKVEGIPTYLFFYSQSMYDSIGFPSHLQGQWFDGGLFPDNLFIPTLLFPFYGVGQFSTILLGEPVFFENYRNAYLVIIPDDIYASLSPNEIINVISEMWNSGDESFTNLINVFDIYDNAFSFSSFISFKIDSQNWRWTLVVIQPYFTLALYFLVGTIIIKIKK